MPMQCISSSSPLGQSEGAAVIAHTIAPVNNLGLVVFMLARLSINIAPTQALSLFHLDSHCLPMQPCTIFVSWRQMNCTVDESIFSWPCLWTKYSIREKSISSQYLPVFFSKHFSKVWFCVTL